MRTLLKMEFKMRNFGMLEIFVLLVASALVMFLAWIWGFIGTI